jgi:hypothetical protein
VLAGETGRSGHPSHGRVPKVLTVIPAVHLTSGLRFLPNQAAHGRCRADFRSASIRGRLPVGFQPTYVR